VCCEGGECAAGGILLIVDHSSASPWAWEQAHDHESLSAEEILGTVELDDEWQRVRVGQRRAPSNRSGNQVAAVLANVIVLRRAHSTAEMLLNVTCEHGIYDEPDHPSELHTRTMHADPATEGLKLVHPLL
jgi:hypothetical protein